MISENTKNSELLAYQENINKRFFLAVDSLVKDGTYKSLSEFCNANGLNRVKYWEMSLTYGPKGSPAIFTRYKAIESAALALLVSRFGFSPLWLLLGNGDIKTHA